ncbi:hypothetical protein LQZ21_08190 [Treponema sp. TIM-1]|uniref:hypothetical protein n=1 Tax=Treponema sp. TIM-1 TaxID=2898417 RepID=UPI0039818F4B
MHVCPPGVNNALPAEYRNVAEALFPPQGFPPGQGPAIPAAEEFAEILGIGADYKRILNTQFGKTIHQLLRHFQNNLDLLIQKTWVEKSDEIRKEKLLDRLPGFIAGIEAGDYPKALKDFGTILEELAYLFFGAQSHKDDFTEYTFRIDSQMGLFWWYGGQIGCLDKASDRECLRAVLLIGICYLTNF